jgi:hypothetical protein
VVVVVPDLKSLPTLGLSTLGLGGGGGGGGGGGLLEAINHLHKNIIRKYRYIIDCKCGFVH